MTTKELCIYLNKTEGQVRQLQLDLNIEGVGVGKIKNWSNIEIARMKLGTPYINYNFVPDIERHWIIYAIGYNNEVKVEI